MGTQFKEFTNANSILLHIIDVRAPWQNGRIERHGDILQKDFRARSLDALSERLCGTSASGYGMLCCQESTVQPFRLLSPSASVRNWTPSSRKLMLRCPSVTASKTQLVLDPGPRRSCGLTISSWCGKTNLPSKRGRWVGHHNALNSVTTKVPCDIGASINVAGQEKTC